MIGEDARHSNLIECLYGFPRVACELFTSVRSREGCDLRLSALRVLHLWLSCRPAWWALGLNKLNVSLRPAEQILLRMSLSLRL